MEGAQDLAPAFDDAKGSGAQALIFLTDNLMFGRRKETAELALSHQLPSIHSFAPEARDGALMSYGPDLAENYRRAAALADRVLKGARPADSRSRRISHCASTSRLRRRSASIFLLLYSLALTR